MLSNCFENTPFQSENAKKESVKPCEREENFCACCCVLFQTNYDEINKLGLMPESFNGLDLTKNITRGEMCELAVYAFEKATGNDIDMSNETFSGFTDTSDQNIIKAHLYGIVNGYEDGSFRPNQLLTRQEFFKLIENFCTAAAFSPKATDGALSGFADAGSISAWAKEAAQICVSYSYVQGTKLLI